MRKVVFALWVFAALYIGGCAKLDSLDGISTDPKTGVTTQNPVNPVSSAAAMANLIPVYGPIIGAGIALAGNVYAAFRVNQAKGNTSAALAAATATASGVGAVVATLPADVQAKMGTAINIAHDAAGVGQALQDSLQSLATGHAAATPVTDVPAAAKAA